MKLRNKKTGEVKDFKIIADYDDITSGWRLETTDGKVLYYDHIDEIHQEWEDYEPKEPLIKDEKTRKAVRAWAEANHLSNFKVYVSDDGEWLQLDGRIECSQDTHSVSFTGTLPSIDANKWYSLAELCGEEE